MDFAAPAPVAVPTPMPQLHVTERDDLDARSAVLAKMAEDLKRQFGELRKENEGLRRELEELRRAHDDGPEPETF
jgi:hypothetical protein